MEQSPPEPLRTPDAPRSVLNRIIENRAGDQFNIPLFLQDVGRLDKMRVTKRPQVLEYLRHVGRDKAIRETLIKRIIQNNDSVDGQKVLEDIRLARILGLEELPNVSIYLTFLRKKYKPEKRSKLKKKVVLAAGATAIAVVSFIGDGGITAKQGTAPITAELATASPPTLTPAETATSTATPRPTETPSPTPEKVVVKGNIFQEFAKLKYETVEKNRDLRKTQDPEYPQRVDEELNQDRINILILGENQKLTDAIIVASYHIPSHTFYLTSLPRDLQSKRALELSGHPIDSRINQVVKLGGKKGIEEMSKETERITGLAIDATTEVDFNYFTKLIDSIGGIDVELDEAIHDNEYPSLTPPHYDPFHISAGKHHLKGAEALKLARTRKSFKKGAHQRDDNQRYVVERIPEQVFGDPFQIIQRLNAAINVTNQSIQDKSLTVDHPKIIDVTNLLDNVKSLSGMLGAAWDRLSSGQGLGQLIARPKVYSTGISQFVVSANIPGVSIDTLREKNVLSADYYSDVKKNLRNFYTQNTEQVIPEEETKIVLPAKEQRILHPQELSYEEVKPWIGKLRDSHDSVITESLFTKEIAGFTNEKRQEVMKAIASAHAKALIEHYGDVDAIIGLDPGHGGTDIGSSGTAPGGKVLREKDLTWEMSQMIADEIYQQSGGKYTTVFLRPENPQDQDLDGDGITSTVERLQKRKAQLLAMEKKLRSNPNGENLIYLSVHFNGDNGNANLKGVETYWPNDIAMANQARRQSSEKLAKLLQQYILSAIRETGYSPVDRGAKKDPDERQPLANSETRTGPYVALGSPKLDRYLRTS